MSLPKHAYNCSIFRFQGRLLLSYRFHDRKDWRTSLQIAELDENLTATSAKPLLAPDEIKDNSLEDCRLFVHQAKLHASFTVSQWPATEFRAVVGYGQLQETDTHWKLKTFYLPGYGKNDFTAIEKNWVFFETPAALFCWYGIVNDEQIVLQLEGPRIEEVFTSKALPWSQGPIHGGAICEGDNGNLLHFFNARTGGKDRSHHRYNIGVEELSGAAPFDMLRIGVRPVLLGEEGYCLDDNKRFKPRVVFCCGAIKDGNSYIVSFGNNDNDCRIVRLGREDLRLWDGRQ